MSIGTIVDRLTRVRWTRDDVAAYVGPHEGAFITHAADPASREAAASGGTVSALLVSMLDAGDVDGALVCVTSVEDGKVRARYRIATTPAEVLEAQGSTYVLGDFMGEALPLLEAFDGTLAVVALPCEITAVSRRAAIASKVRVRITLFCGHATETPLIDETVARLTSEAGGAKLTGYRFRVGHWRGNLRAEFSDGTVLEKPSGFYNTYQNLYVCSPKKCIFCGDHFGYDADLCAGDIWSAKYKGDPVKHTALIAKTAIGSETLRACQSRGAIEATGVEIGEVLDGQRRVAPFHYNVNARAVAAEAFGMRIPQRDRTPVRWHERAAARLVLRSHVESGTPEGAARTLAVSRRALRLKLYYLKALESLPPSRPVPAASVAGTPGQSAVRPPFGRSRRFALVAATVSGNRGAEAMLETTIGRIRDHDPDADFIVYSYMPAEDAARVTDARVTIRSSTPAHLVLVLFPLTVLTAAFRLIRIDLAPLMPGSVRDLAGCDGLIDLAGVSFIDGREKFLPFNILTILPAMLLRVPVFKLSQAVGPFTDLLNRQAARLLRRCELVVARGEKTLEYLRSIDFPEKRMMLAPDVAFAFQLQDSLSREGEDEVRRICDALGSARKAGVSTVGICPSSVIAGKAAAQGWDYIGFLSRVVEGLIADGHVVVLFPNATRADQPDKLRNNDLPVIRQVEQRLAGSVPDGALYAVEGDINAAGVDAVIQRCDCVAVSRFHAMVGALRCGVPVLVLGWSHKYLEVMQRFALEDWVFDYTEHDPDAFLARLRALCSVRDAVASSVTEALPAVRQEALAQIEVLLGSLEGSTR